MEIKISIRAEGESKGTKTIQTPCFIGRSKEVGLTISHPSVSRKHCEIYEEAGQLYLRDNGSLNGTLLKGEFVETAVPIQPGDEFVVGELQLRIETIPSADADTEDRFFAALESAAEIVTSIQPTSNAEEDDGELRLAPE